MSRRMASIIDLPYGCHFQFQKDGPICVMNHKYMRPAKKGELRIGRKGYQYQIRYFKDNRFTIATFNYANAESKRVYLCDTPEWGFNSSRPPEIKLTLEAQT